jgi:hypothetical protein
MAGSSWEPYSPVGRGVVDGPGLAGAGVVLGLVHEPDEQPVAEGGQPPGLGVDGGVGGAGGDVRPAPGGAAEDPALPAREQEPAPGGIRLLLGGRPGVVPVVVAVQDVDPPAIDRLPALDVAGRLPGVAAHQAPSRGTSRSDTAGAGAV